MTAASAARTRSAPATAAHLSYTPRVAAANAARPRGREARHGHAALAQFDDGSGVLGPRERGKFRPLPRARRRARPCVAPRSSRPTPPCSPRTPRTPRPRPRAQLTDAERVEPRGGNRRERPFLRVQGPRAQRRLRVGEGHRARRGPETRKQVDEIAASMPTEPSCRPHRPASAARGRSSSAAR